MKRITILFLSVILLSGCATYKFERGKAPYDKGYVVTRDNITIPEYTLGVNNTVPQDLTLAQGRFKRRQGTIESYYKESGRMESRFKETFLDPPVMLVKIVLGIFRVPFIAISDYKYAHNPEYKKAQDRKELEEEVEEQARIKKLKEQTNDYIQKDLIFEASLGKVEQKLPEEAQTQPKEKISEEVPAKEPPESAAVSQPAKQVEEKAPEVKLEPQEALPEEKPAGGEKKSASSDRELLLQPKAFILAKPVRGYSPLTVHFYGSKSYTPRGRIVSYSWDFGDGDTSTKLNPVNTYYSASFGSRSFTATLTIKDNLGRTATRSIVIEVLNK